MLNPEDVVLESAPGELMGALKEIDQQIAFLQGRQQFALAAHAAERGWSMTTHNVNLDLASGMFTVSPLPQEADAAPTD